jgi:RHS repeat-associated protein
VQLTYNATGQLIREERPDGEFVTYERDASGVLINSTVAGMLRPRERHDTDACGQTVRVSRWDGARWISQTHQYDARGRLVRTVTPDGAATDIIYDLLGRPISHTSPETGCTLRLFDAVGSEVWRRNAAGQEVRREYDALRRPLRVFYSDSPEPDVTYEYLDTGSPVPADGVRSRIGRAWRVTDPAGMSTFAYDQLGRTVSTTRTGTPVPGTFTTDVTYDRLGRVTRVILPSVVGGGPRETVTYTYDDAGRPQSATGVIAAVEYDLWGRIVRLEYTNGTVTENTFDPTTGRLTHQQVLGPGGVTLLDQTATYDNFGQLESLATPGGSTTFAYDGLQRLADVTHPNALVETFAYMDGGNATQGSLGAMTYAPGTALLTGAGGQSYSHDAAGRLKIAPYGALTFDADDHLVRVDLAGGGTLQHGYDYLDHLAFTRRKGALQFVAVGEQLEFHDGRPTLWLSFGGRRLVAVSGGERRWLHPDVRGNISLITDEGGASVFSAEYSGYGLLLSSNGSVSPGAGFLGSGVDDTGLICLGLRWYDPRLGRFISPDAMVAGVFIIDAWNPYVYAHNNPVVFVDSTGAWSFWGVLAVALLVAVIVVAAVFTGGAALAGLGVLASGLSTGTMVAVGIGAFGGALAGGLAAWKSGGSVWGGAILGGIIGGACALAGGAIGSAILESLGRTYGAFMLSGAIQGAIGGFGTGFVVGFAGGKGTLGSALLAATRGAIWGAFFGMVLGFGARYLFIGEDGAYNYFEFGTVNRYIPDMAPKGDPSSFAVWDNSLGTSEDAVFTGSHIADKTLGASDIGDIVDITCIRDIGDQTYNEINGAFIAFGKDGSLVMVNLTDIANAMGNGGISIAAETSVLLDANGFSYAQQFALLLKNIPVLGNFLAFADEYKLGWYEDASKGFNVFWGTHTQQS